MEKMNALTLIITLVVGVILTGALLGPVVNDATNTEDTFTNEGLWRMAELKDGDDYTYIDPNWTYENDPLNINKTGSNALLGEEWCIRSNGQYRSSTGSGNLVNVALATTDNITFTGSGINGAYVQSLPGYGARADGDFIMSDYNKPTYVLKDSLIYATGVSTVDGVSMIIHIEGNIEDGVTINAYSQFNANSNPYPNTISDVVVSNVSINAEAISGYVDLYKLTSITADVSFTNTTPESVVSTHSGDITYSSYVVPYQVTAELAEHLTPGQISLIGAIPVMVIVALLMAAVGAIALRRAD